MSGRSSQKLDLALVRDIAEQLTGPEMRELFAIKSFSLIGDAIGRQPLPSLAANFKEGELASLAKKRLIKAVDPGYPKFRRAVITLLGEMAMLLRAEIEMEKAGLLPENPEPQT